MPETTTLVTGALGYIGSHLCKRLDSDGLSLDIQAGAHITSCISEVEKHLLRLQGVETVIHLADLRFQELNPGNLEENVARHRAFFSGLKRLPRLRKVVFSSSCSVYGSSADEITENSAVNPTSAYAESKLATEGLLRKSGLPYVILRFGTAYGMSSSMREDLLVNQLAIAAARSASLELFDLKARRPYIHCEDFADALLTARAFPAGSLLNVVERNLSKEELLNLFQSLFPGRLKALLVENRSDVRNYSVCNRLAESMAIRPQWKLPEGIKQMVAHYA